MLAEDFTRRSELEWSPDPNPVCEECGRSIVMRFQEDWAPASCPSCQADFDRLLLAGKVKFR